MGTQPNVLELARQGNAKAIAALINRSLKPHGITASARLKSDCLHIMLEAAQVPKQSAIVRFVYRSMAKLKSAPVRTIKVYGRQVGQDFPAWSNTLVLPSHHLSAPSTPTRSLRPTLKKKQLSAERVGVQKSDREQEQPGLAAIAQPPVKLGSLSHEPDSKSVKFPTPLGRLLITALVVQIGFDSLLTLFSLMAFTASAFYNALVNWESRGISIGGVALILNGIETLWESLSFIDGCLLWTTMALFLVWLYRLQIKLHAAFPQYPITPWGAVARFFLPFYNFWGIWNLLTTIANYLRSWNHTVRWGEILRRWSPWYYAAWLVIWILQRTDWIVGRLGDDQPIPLWFDLVLYVMSLALSLLMLRIVWIIHQGTSQLRD